MAWRLFLAQCARRALARFVGAALRIVVWTQWGGPAIAVPSGRRLYATARGSASRCVRGARVRGGKHGSDTRRSRGARVRPRRAEFQFRRLGISKALWSPSNPSVRWAGDCRSYSTCRPMASAFWWWRVSSTTPIAHEPPLRTSRLLFLFDIVSAVAFRTGWGRYEGHATSGSESVALITATAVAGRSWCLGTPPVCAQAHVMSSTLWRNCLITHLASARRPSACRECDTVPS
jgi:hypothetical protein